MNKPVTWLKAKYTTEKTKGRYKSSHNDSTKRRRHTKNGNTEENRTVLVVGPTGKRRFQHG